MCKSYPRLNLAIPLLITSVGLAQQVQIAGRVTDRSNTPLADVKITVTDTDEGSARNTVTNALGYYAVPLLQPANYKITAEKSGFLPREETGIDLRMRKNATINLALEALEADTAIHVDVQQVLVPVVVTDKKGHHVSGLRAFDFQIFEDGVRQEMASFGSDTAGAVDDVAALSKPTGASAPPGPRHTFVICVDTLHASAAGAAHVREVLENLFEKEKPGDAQYVLIGIGRQLQVLQPATTNPLAILIRIRSAAFRTAMTSSDASALAAQLQQAKARIVAVCAATGKQSCDSQNDAVKQSIDAMAEPWAAPAKALLDQFKSVVEELAKIPTGRTLILVSDGFGIDPKREFYDAIGIKPPTAPDSLRDTLQIAVDRNVIIFTIDSRNAAPASSSMDASRAAGSPGDLIGMGARTKAPPIANQTTLQSPSQANPFAISASMQELAVSTGGVYYHDSAAMLKQLRGALADGRQYYVLSYVPKNTAHDGKFRTITVELNDKKMSVRAKPGYWAAGAAQ